MSRQRTMSQRRPFGPVERDLLRMFYHRIPAREIARELNRPVRCIHRAASRLGLGHARTRIRSPRAERFLREKHARGWPDRPIAAILRCARESVGDWRRRLGLPSNQYGEWCTERVRRNTRRQCRAAGVPNLGQLRMKVLSERSARMGWPPGLPWRAAQILSALWERGPMTRGEIVEAIRPDLRGRCNRVAANGALHDNGRYGGGANNSTYLGNLLKRGLIVDLGGIVRTGRRGGYLHIYSLPMNLVRRTPDSEQSNGTRRDESDEQAAG